MLSSDGAGILFGALREFYRTLRDVFFLRCGWCFFEDFVCFSAAFHSFFGVFRQRFFVFRQRFLGAERGNFFPRLGIFAALRGKKFFIGMPQKGHFCCERCALRALRKHPPCMMEKYLLDSILNIMINRNYSFLLL